MLSGIGHGQRHRRHRQQNLERRIQATHQPDARFQIGRHPCHAMIAEDVPDSVEPARHRARRHRIGLPGIGILPRLGQAEGEDEDVRQQDRLPKCADHRAAAEQRLGAAREAVRFDGGAQRIEDPPALLPELRRLGGDVSRGESHEVEELRSGVDVRRPGGKDAIVEAPCDLGRTAAGRRFGIDPADLPGDQRAADMLGKARAEGREPRIRRQHPARGPEALKPVYARLGDARPPVGGRRQHGIGVCAVLHRFNPDHPP